MARRGVVVLVGIAVVFALALFATGQGRELLERLGKQGKLASRQAEQTEGELEARLEEETEEEVSERIGELSSRQARRFAGSVRDLERLVERIQARIDRLEARGVDTVQAQSDLDNARRLLEETKKEISSLGLSSEELRDAREAAEL